MNAGVTVHNRRTTSRPATLDDRERRHLRRIVNSDRRATVQEITAQFNSGRARHVSQWTICRNVGSMGYESRRRARVLLLTQRHRAQRRAFVASHQGWTLEQWRNVIWSNESRFQQHHADGRHRVWRRPHEAMDPACPEGVIQGTGVSVMVGGAFSWYGMVRGMLSCSETISTHFWPSSAQTILRCFKMITCRHIAPTSPGKGSRNMQRRSNDCHGHPGAPYEPYRAYLGCPETQASYHGSCTHEQTSIGGRSAYDLVSAASRGLPGTCQLTSTASHCSLQGQRRLHTLLGDYPMTFAKSV
ncbi:uncharacterized protein [Anabrus simplex]|uniref:uncharacterized protein n=1 Tax=Anabrus simplex TaxID=316456 RepID=UPI0035A28C31